MQESNFLCAVPNDCKLSMCLLYFTVYNYNKKPEGYPSVMLCVHNMMGACQNVIMDPVSFSADIRLQLTCITVVGSAVLLKRI